MPRAAIDAVEVEPRQCPRQALSQIAIINAAGFLTLQAIGAAERQGRRVIHTETVATEAELMQRLPNHAGRARTILSWAKLGIGRAWHAARQIRGLTAILSHRKRGILPRISAPFGSLTPRFEFRDFARVGPWRLAGCTRQNRKPRTPSVMPQL